MLVGTRFGGNQSVVQFNPPRDLANRLKRRLRRGRIQKSFKSYLTTRPGGYELFSDDRSEHRAIDMEQFPTGDVINLHWIARFVDFKSFFSNLPPKIPVFWTLHDMAPFCGGCHYDNGCKKFRTGCGACPQLGSEVAGDLSRQIWQRKAGALAKIPSSKLHIVACSRWLADEVRNQSMFSRFPISVITPGIDLKTFAPRHRCFSRDILNLPANARIVLFSAHSIDIPRKGFDLLQQALNQLDKIPNLLLVSLGHGTPQMKTSIPHVHLGHIEEERMLSIVYSAADIFAMPSLQEAFGFTGLEAMACGTPVIAFDVGGIRDFVQPGCTGFLVKAGDVTGLATAIAEVLKDEQRRLEMSAQCRHSVEEKFPLKLQAQRYVDLYRSTLPAN
ncbi:MAG TPA: glycosyltransferase family 4 protein [Candidatus Binatia bacterium]|jgi:glycosyltransferase involved in cell wall biosynthesis|nr:glycosyltransferase family 4 protein [Candidatus Binatia bacterium]